MEDAKLKIAFSPIYRYALPDKHRFPMAKYELLPEQLLYEGTVGEDHFYLYGVDVLATDKLGRLSLTIAGCRERDCLVLDCCRRRRIPVAVSMGGGYSERMSHIIEAHANTFRTAQELFF